MPSVFCEGGRADWCTQPPPLLDHSTPIYPFHSSFFPLWWKCQLLRVCLRDLPSLWWIFSHGTQLFDKWLEVCGLAGFIRSENIICSFFLSLSLLHTDRQHKNLLFFALFAFLSHTHTQRHLSSSSIYGNSIFISFGFFFPWGGWRYFNPFWHPMTSFIPNHVTKLKTVNKINPA